MASQCNDTKHLDIRSFRTRARSVLVTYSSLCEAYYFIRQGRWFHQTQVPPPSNQSKRQAMMIQVETIMVQVSVTIQPPEFPHTKPPWWCGFPCQRTLQKLHLEVKVSNWLQLCTVIWFLKKDSRDLQTVKRWNVKSQQPMQRCRKISEWKKSPTRWGR